MSNILNIKILIGIPGSGKSTWAKDYVAQHRNLIRINRDDLRHILVEDVFTDGNESIINKAKLSLIRVAIENDRNIVLDDTHCYKDYLIFLIDYIRKTAREFEKNVEIEILDFDIPTNICVDRNSKRTNSVPVTIIYHMINEKREIPISQLDIDKYIIMS